MRRVTALALLVAGVALLVYGMSATDSLSSSISKLFTGAPTDKAIWLLLAGIVGLVLGFFSLLRPRHS